MKKIKMLVVITSITIVVFLLSIYLSRHWLLKRMLLASSPSKGVSKDIVFMPIQSDEDFHEKLMEALYKNEMFSKMNANKRDALVEQLYHFICANRFGSWDQYQRFRWPTGTLAGKANTNHILSSLLPTLAKNPQSVPSLSNQLITYSIDRSNSLSDQRFAWLYLINYATNYTLGERLFAPGQWTEIGFSEITITQVNPSNLPNNKVPSAGKISAINYGLNLGNGMQVVQPVDDMESLHQETASVSLIVDVIMPIATSRSAGRYHCGVRLGWSDKIGAWIPFAMAVDNKLESYAYLF